jgi:hypothetical protein
MCCQDFERKKLALPKALVENKPDSFLTVESLSYKSANFFFRLGDQYRPRMLAAIERLPNKEDQIKFLQKHQMLVEAAKLMCQEPGEFRWCWYGCVGGCGVKFTWLGCVWVGVFVVQKHQMLVEAAKLMCQEPGKIIVISAL